MSVAESVAQQQVRLLYSDHSRWLFGWLRRKLGCPADADDLVQDTFLRIVKSPEMTALREPRRFLVTIARGLAIDLFRRRSLERLYLDALAALPEPEWPSEEERAITLETLLQIDAMLAGLGPKVRAAFILSQFDGQTYQEIAGQLGLSLRTVNNYVARAMEHCCLYRLQHSL